MGTILAQSSLMYVRMLRVCDSCKSMRHLVICLMSKCTKHVCWKLYPRTFCRCVLSQKVAMWHVARNNILGGNFLSEMAWLCLARVWESWHRRLFRFAARGHPFSTYANFRISDPPTYPLTLYAQIWRHYDNNTLALCKAPKSVTPPPLGAYVPN